MTNAAIRLPFGPNKYAALHLLLCRWLRLCADRSKKYCYVTLGGTELRDIASVGFIDKGLVTKIWSYETNSKRFQIAKDTAAELAASHLKVEVQNGTFFSHERRSDLPHIYFADFLGVCAYGDYYLKFADMFQNEVIREGDCLLITSHLGHNPGLSRTREHFGGEFAVLGIDDNDKALVRRTFRHAHPTMTLFKALCVNGIQSELALNCFGIMKYRDKTPMGIYGYTVSEGKTELSAFVADTFTNHFDVNNGRLCKPEDF